MKNDETGLEGHGGLSVLGGTDSVVRGVVYDVLGRVVSIERRRRGWK